MIRSRVAWFLSWGILVLLSYPASLFPSRPFALGGRTRGFSRLPIIRHLFNKGFNDYSLRRSWKKDRESSACPQAIGRDSRGKKNQTDGVDSVPIIHHRYLVAFIYPITATIKSFLEKRAMITKRWRKCIIPGSRPWRWRQFCGPTPTYAPMNSERWGILLSLTLVADKYHDRSHGGKAY